MKIINKILLIVLVLIFSGCTKNKKVGMNTLKEDIKTQSEWIVEAFKQDGYKLDYSINSFIEIDRFFEDNSLNGEPVKEGRLETNSGLIVFSIASYIGETFIRTTQNAKWITDDSDPNGEINISIEFGDGAICWPAQKVIKRYKNGFEDAIYMYGYIMTKDMLNIEFDNSFWELNNNIKSTPWE